MKTRDLFLGLLISIHFCILPGCNNENDLIPDHSDIKTTIRVEGAWVIADVTIKGTDPKLIRECGIEWEIGFDKNHIRIGDKKHSMVAEKGDGLSYSFRIFPWNHFISTYYANKCKIHITPYVNVGGKLVNGSLTSKDIENKAQVKIWTHKSEIIDKYHIRFQGEFTRTDRLQIEECGIYWSKNESADPEDYTKCVSSDLSTDFSVTIKDIAHLQKIYLFGYVKTPYGTIYSTLSPAYIPGGQMTVTIASMAKEHTFERFTVSGECSVKNPVLYPITEHGFCYILSSIGYMPTIKNDKIIVGEGEGSYTGTITGLEPFTKYTIRAYAISNGVATYSNSINAYTSYAFLFIPVIGVTSAKTNPDQSKQVLLESKIIDDKGYMVTERGFCYNTTGVSPTVEDQTVVAEGTGLGTFKATLNLTPGKYFFKAYAKNQAGINYSTDYKEVDVK